LTTLHVASFRILDAIAEAHNTIINEYEEPSDAGQCTLLGGFLAQIVKSKNGDGRERWAFVFGSVGDCKGFLYRHRTGEVIDLTVDIMEARSDCRDSGGRLGPATTWCKPDLRNFKLSYVECEKGDILVMGSDGLHDNLDPQSIGKTVQELGYPQGEDWDSIDPEEVAQLKNDYRCWLLKQLAFRCLPGEVPDPKHVAMRLVRHCLGTTRRSRDFMETYEDKKLPENYQEYPGKMDHTSIVCVRVHKLPRPNKSKSRPRVHEE